jgi:hypothetical protein
VDSGLGLETIIDDCVDLGDRPGAYRPGRKALSLIHTVIVGGDCIDDADILRTGSTGLVVEITVCEPVSVYRGALG